MSLPKGEIIRESWRLTRKHLRFLCVAVMPAILWSVTEVVTVSIGGIKNPHFHEKAVGFLFSFFSQIVEMGMIGVSLRVVRGGVPDWSDFAAPYKKFWRLYFVGLASDAPIRATLFAVFLVPFVSLANLLAFDKDLPFLAAFQRSVKWVSGVWGSVFLLCLFLDLIAVTGLLFFGIGTLIAFPFIWVTHAKLYETIRLRVEAASPEVAE